MTSSDRWQRVSVQHSPGLIGIHDLDGTIRYMNPAAARVLGYEPAMMVGRNFADFIAPSAQPYFAPAMERLRTQGAGEGLVLMLAKDGTPRRWWYRHVLYEEPGEAPVVLGDSTDITEIYSPDEALQESEQRFRYLAENIHQVFWIRDPRTGQILYLSPAFERVWGRPRAWMLEQPFGFMETLHLDDRTLVLENFVKSANGETTQMEYRIQHPDGTERWIASHAFPVRDARGDVARIVAITEDITQRKQAEDALRRARDAAEEATREKSLLLAHVSHEVRTPLQVIFGLTDILLDTELAPEQRAEIERVAKAARTLNTLANDLLDFSKIEVRKLELRSEPFNIREVLDLATEPFTARMSHSPVTVSADLAADVPAVLVGDADRLRQVLANLIGNASKFAERGDVRATISVADRDTGRVVLRCTVRDSGPGIAPEDQRRIFEPFSQAHTATKREQRGVGLGLAICAQLVQLMGGRMWVESALGQGSTFGFTASFAVAPAAHHERFPDPSRTERTD